MKFVSPLLKHVVYPGLSKAGYLRRAGQSEPAVLTYHGVLPAEYKIIDPQLDGNLVSPESFRGQLQFLQDRYNIISPKEFLNWCEGWCELPARSVLLTCDDGLRNCFYDMLPLLQEFEIQCLFFVTGASLSPMPTMLWYEQLYLMIVAAHKDFTIELPQTGGRIQASPSTKHSTWWELVKKLSQHDPEGRKRLLETIRVQSGLGENWDAKYSEDPALRRRFLLLNQSELKQLVASGACVGAHTLSHPMLSQSSTEVAWTEISENKRALDQVLGQETWALAYPFGDSTSVSLRELEMAERAGFTAAFMNIDEGRTSISNFSFHRMHVTADMSLTDLEARISGFHRTLQQLFRPSERLRTDRHSDLCARKRNHSKGRESCA
jgi:peptidoglycan/xylan/chitin deacetylase (PgdA/CDA1 family)